MGRPYLSSNLPKHHGKYGVGVIDLEIPCERRRLSDTVLEKNGNLAFEVINFVQGKHYSGIVSIF